MASDTDGIISTIETRADSNWPLASSTISFQGVDFKPPNGPWLRVTVLFGSTERWTHGGTGSGINVQSGVVDLDIFDQAGSGFGTIRGYADTLRDAFDRVTDGVVEFGAASGPQVFNDRDGEWIALKVSVPFTSEETT